MINKRTISIIGGAGHVGFPLGLILSSKGYNVNLIDKDRDNLKKINQGMSPFLEEGSQNLLAQMLKQKQIRTTYNLKEVVKSKYIIICIGTPIDGKLRPKTKEFLNFFKHLKKYLKKRSPNNY